MSFKRIQFTPDLLPADVTGTLVWEQARGTFSVRQGPIFANIILADEINRAPAKVQSALLEAMEERQVTIGEKTYPLPEPFLVLATQNPIEHEGTYPLPEAELDRFLIKILVQYPAKQEEIKIVQKNMEAPTGSFALASVQPVFTEKDLRFIRSVVDHITVDPKLLDYMVTIVSATRPVRDRKTTTREDLYRYIAFGASPRASISLYRCARIKALLENRSYVLPEDVKAVAPPVLRHRLVCSYEAEADGVDSDALIGRILSYIPVP
jgi:MoxR-like ATPase